VPGKPDKEPRHRGRVALGFISRDRYDSGGTRPDPEESCMRVIIEYCVV
jgi:hypothetical protein